MNVLPGIALSAATLLAACQPSAVQTSQHQSESTADCGFYEANILDKYGNIVGSAEVTDADGILHILLSAADGYRFWTLRAYAGIDPIPVNADGNTSPSWFPIEVILGDGSHDASAYPTVYDLAIPLADIGVEAGTCGQINVAVYARMKKFDANGIFLANPRVWVDGPLSFGDVNDPHHDGTGFTYEFCCDEEEEHGCTLTQGYWKTHHATARQKPLRKAWPGPSETDLLCDQELLDIMNTPPEGDGWYILAHQYIAASLNVSAGASSPADVAEALAEAGDLLESTCGGMTDAERALAISLAETLDAYNNGEIGPGHCE